MSDSDKAPLRKFRSEQEDRRRVVPDDYQDTLLHRHAEKTTADLEADCKAAAAEFRAALDRLPGDDFARRESLRLGIKARTLVDAAIKRCEEARRTQRRFPRSPKPLTDRLRRLRKLRDKVGAMNVELNRRYPASPESQQGEKS